MNFALQISLMCCTLYDPVILKTHACFFSGHFAGKSELASCQPDFQSILFS